MPSGFGAKVLCMRPLLVSEYCSFRILAGHVLIVAMGLAAGQVLHAQSTDDRANRYPPIEEYIEKAWSTLTRSTDDCRAFADVKVTGKAHLFIPKELPITPSMLALENHCGIMVQHLPRQIHQMGDLPVTSLTDNGLLYLPRPYVVPGGRFNEMYGWDSYFIERGLLASNHEALAKDIVDNFIFEVEHYGGVLTANRTYYLSRSQPPFLATMILDYYRRGHEKLKPPPTDRNWLLHAYRAAAQGYQLWVSPARKAGQLNLAHYADSEEGPVPEMSDADDYYPKVIRWFQLHPAAAIGELVALNEASLDAKATDDPGWACDPAQSRACRQARIGDTGLSRDFYRGDRADRESGFDTTFRFGPFADKTHHFAPVCLNSLLFRYEMDMATIAEILRRKKEAAGWRKRASARRRAINRLMWNQSRGLYLDYDYVTGQQSTYLYLTAFYPLWAGLADEKQASALVENLSHFEHSSGLAMSETESGLQWDYPFGWAPCNWLAVAGLMRYGRTTAALRIADKFATMVEKNYRGEGTIREKYDVVTGSTDVLVKNGYTDNVTGFGWTNGVYLSIEQLRRDVLNKAAHRALHPAH